MAIPPVIDSLLICHALGGSMTPLALFARYVSVKHATSGGWPWPRTSLRTGERLRFDPHRGGRGKEGAPRPSAGLGGRRARRPGGTQAPQRVGDPASALEGPAGLTAPYPQARA